MPDEVEPSFEAAVAQLEEIVEALERGEPELTAALAKYESGVRLLNRCYGLLERAERSVALLTGVDEQGEPVSAPFDATATIAREAQGPAGAGGGADEPAAGTARKRGRVRRTKPATAPQEDPMDPPF
jgi:exodeoxyribonuclease VII small subunit